jgi:hypothetical protein
LVWLLRAILQVALSPVHCFPQVSLINDVVAIKDSPRFVPTDSHGNSLRDTSADHVANGCPAKIVEDAPGVLSLDTATLATAATHGMLAAIAYIPPQTCRDTRRRPCLAEISNLRAVAVEYVRRKLHAALGFDLPRFATKLKEMPQIATESDCTSFTVFGILTAQSDDIAFDI